MLARCLTLWVVLFFEHISLSSDLVAEQKLAGAVITFADDFTWKEAFYSHRHCKARAPGIIKYGSRCLLPPLWGQHLSGRAERSNLLCCSCCYISSHFCMQCLKYAAEPHCQWKQTRGCQGGYSVSFTVAYHSMKFLIDAWWEIFHGRCHKHSLAQEVVSFCSDWVFYGISCCPPEGL